MEQFLFSRIDGAAAIGVSPRTFDYLIHGGVLPAGRVGKKLMGSRGALGEFSKRGISIIPKRAAEKECAAVGA